MAYAKNNWGSKGNKKDSDRSEMRITGSNGFIEDGPQDEYKTAVLRPFKNMLLRTVIKIKYCLPQNERKADASLVECDRTTGKKLRLTIKREARVGKAHRLIICLCF